MVLHRHVLSLDVAGFAEGFTKRISDAHGYLGRSEVDEGDDRQCRLLRARAERRCHHHTPNQRNELAPPHSITSLASVSTLGGIVRPSGFAAFKLMIKSNFTGCWTGRSPGFSPLRILST